MRLEDLKHGRTGIIGFGREARVLETQVLERIPSAKVEVIAEQTGDFRPVQWPIFIRPLDQAELDYARIIRSPGVPVDHPALVRARSRGVEITTSSSLWFAERPDARSIVVTGSKGKSTTSALIAHLLSAAGHSVELAGNIGIPLVSLMDSRADWFVIELSSYQLVDLQASPEMGVITRLFPEHIDWHGSVERYYGAKLRLLELLQGRPLWINAMDPVLNHAVQHYAGLNPVNLGLGLHAESDGLYFVDQMLLPASEWLLAGKHNLDNLALAASLVSSLGVERDVLIESAKAFRPLAHRLQQFNDAEGRCWINDSISSTPFATQAALECCSDDVVLIAGGLDRPTDWRCLIDHRIRAGGQPLTGVVGLPDTGATVINILVEGGLVDAGKTRLATDMPSAVEAARSLAGSASQVLLSPGAPSFPHYRDFEDRGRQFMQAVLEMS